MWKEGKTISHKKPEKSSILTPSSKSELGKASHSCRGCTASSFSREMMECLQHLPPRRLSPCRVPTDGVCSKRRILLPRGSNETARTRVPSCKANSAGTPQSPPPPWPGLMKSFHLSYFWRWQISREAKF